MGLTLLARIPVWAWVVVGLLIWAGYGSIKVAHLERQRAEVAAESQRIAERVRAAKAAQARKVEEEYAAKIRRANSSAAATKSANERLQSQLAARSDYPRDAVAVCGVDGARGRKLEELLAESAGLAAEGAERVERLGAKTASLQDYIQRVCVGQKNADHQD
jgi:DNA-binding ferritin-like protein